MLGKNAFHTTLQSAFLLPHVDMGNLHLTFVRSTRDPLSLHFFIIKYWSFILNGFFSVPLLLNVQVRQKEITIYTLCRWQQNFPQSVKCPFSNLKFKFPIDLERLLIVKNVLFFYCSCCCWRKETSKAWCCSCVKMQRLEDTNISNLQTKYSIRICIMQHKKY